MADEPGGEAAAETLCDTCGRVLPLDEASTCSGCGATACDDCLCGAHDECVEAGPELHAAAPPAGVAPVALHALRLPLPAPAPASDATELRIVVVPPADDEGRLPTLSGPTHRVSDPVALAAAMEAQLVQVRVDFDHETEPGAGAAYRGTSAARGWLRGFGVRDGAIEATMHGAEALGAVAAGRFRHVSPALWRRQDDGEVLGASSLALTNRPNLVLEPLTTRHGGDMKDDDERGDAREADLKRREADVERREADVERHDRAAAEAAVDRAVADGRIREDQKEFFLHSIRGHVSGSLRGVEAFEAAFPGAGNLAEPNALTRRIAPAGAPPRAAPALHALPWTGGAEDHEAIVRMAAAHGVDFREALRRIGALRGAV